MFNNISIITKHVRDLIYCFIKILLEPNINSINTI